jgi:hypothetical protein
VYVQQVANTPLLAASFGQINLQHALSGSIVIDWLPVAGEVRLRTYALKPRTYYQMDSRRPAGTASFSWPTDVLAALKLTASDIGVVAWTEGNIGSTRRDVYLPVRIGDPLALPEGMYELFVLPGSELNELFIGLTAVSADGKTSAALSKPVPLRYGYYPAGRSIRIPVGPIPKPGIYFVEIGATLKGGGAISRELWFIHAAASPR